MDILKKIKMAKNGPKRSKMVINGVKWVVNNIFDHVGSFGAVCDHF